MPFNSLQSILYLASHNPGKLREFREAALARGIQIESLPGIKSLPACLEDGKTFEENARKKALHYSSFVSGPIFADDSGICVDALGGAPGVFSARFAGPKSTDDENNRKMLQELRWVETGAPPYNLASQGVLVGAALRRNPRTGALAVPRIISASLRWRRVARFSASPREEWTA